MSGVNSIVYSYGGAFLFVAFLAEMRHPWDFWKGMLSAQLFICVVYVFFGGFVYGYWVRPFFFPFYMMENRHLCFCQGEVSIPVSRQLATLEVFLFCYSFPPFPRLAIAA